MLLQGKGCFILAKEVVEAMSLKEFEISSLLITKLGKRLLKTRGPLQGFSKQFNYLPGVFLGFSHAFYVFKDAFICYEHPEIGLPHEGHYRVLDHSGKAIKLLVFDYDTNGTFIPDHGSVRNHFGRRVLRTRWWRIWVVRRGVNVARVIRRASMVGLAGR